MQPQQMWVLAEFEANDGIREYWNVRLNRHLRTMLEHHLEGCNRKDITKHMGNLLEWRAQIHHAGHSCRYGTRILFEAWHKYHEIYVQSFTPALRTPGAEGRLDIDPLSCAGSQRVSTFYSHNPTHRCGELLWHNEHVCSW